MRIVIACLAALLVAAGCGKSSARVLGVAPKGEPRSILSVQAGDSPRLVTVRGVMVEKCPVAGCWFRLQDESGVIKVDTKTAGFVVSGIPLKAVLTVAGRVAQDGDETVIAASGLRY